MLHTTVVFAATVRSDWHGGHTLRAWTMGARTIDAVSMSLSLFRCALSPAALQVAKKLGTLYWLRIALASEIAS